MQQERGTEERWGQEKEGEGAGAAQVGTAYVGRCPVTIQVNDGIVDVSGLDVASDAGRVPTLRLWESQVARIIDLDELPFDEFLVRMHSESVQEHSEIILSIFSQAHG